MEGDNGVYINTSQNNMQAPNTILILIQNFKSNCADVHTWGENFKKKLET